MEYSNSHLSEEEDMSLSSAAQSLVFSDDSQVSADDIMDDVLMEDQGEHSPTIFDIVSSELTALGAIPLERFAVEDNPVELGCIPLEPTPITLTSSSKAVSQESKNDHHQAVAKLYEACLRAFDSTDPISFDYKEDLGPNSRECILTITRPDGRKRSYTSGPYFSKKNEAKSHVAALAIGMNVMSFIQYGDINTRGGPNLLDSLDAQTRLKTQDGKGISYFDKRETIVDDPNVKAISDCCIEWRAGLVKPIYVHFSEPSVTVRVHGKKTKIPSDAEIMALKQGCALKIEISSFTFRVYSVHHTYLTRVEAKAAVAAVAIEQGVLEFIKHANGQTSPTVFIRELDDDASEHLNKEVINETIEREKEVEIEATAVNVTLKKHQIPLDVMTLQAFTNSLPKPFPETPGLKPLGDGNPIGWLNSAVQSARGSKMNITWTYLSDAKRSLHGCLIRFTLPRTADGRSYLVEPQFTKRLDAKSAVALLAISQNVGGWIAGISETIENLLPQDVKQKAYSLVPTLTHECKRAGLNQQPVYSFDHEEGAIGCTLRVEFDPGLWREYTVPVQYRTRLEARLAAVLQACEEGILEFIRFKDKTPPPGYIRDSWRTRQIRGPHDIKIEDQDIKRAQMDTRRHSYPQGRGIERYDRKQGPNAHHSSIPRGPRIAGPVRNRIGRYRQGDSFDMQERFAGQSMDERHPNPAPFSSMSFESIGSTSDHHPTPEVTQIQDAESQNPGLSQYAIVRGHPSHVSESVHPGGGGPVPMMFEQTVQFSPVHTVPPPPLYPSGPFSHTPVHIPFASQPHFFYPYPSSLPNQHPLQPPSYPLLPPVVPPSVYSPTNTFGTGRHPNSLPFSPDSEPQFNRFPPASYDERPSGPSGPDGPGQFGRHGSVRVTNNPGLKTDFWGSSTLEGTSIDQSRSIIRSRSNTTLGQGGLREPGSTRPSSGQSEKVWDSSRSAIHENAKKLIQSTLGNKGDGPVALEVQPVEVKAKPKPAGQRVEAVSTHALGMHAGTHTKGHNVPAVSEIAKISPTSLQRTSPEKKGSYEALLLAYCAEQGIKRPVFSHEETSPGQFTMSVIVGKEKFSLNTLFSNLHAGREGISRKVLSRVKEIAKKQNTRR